MSCGCKENKSENTININGNVNNDNKLSYGARVLTFGVGFLLAPIILIGVYYLMFKHIIIKGEMVLDFQSIIKDYVNWKKQKEENDNMDEMSDEEYDDINPDDYELITKVDNVN